VIPPRRREPFALGSSAPRTSDYTRPAVSDETPLSEASPPSQEPQVEGASEPPVELDPLEASKAEVAKLRDQLLRTAADFDNFRKRSRRELGETEKRAREDLIKELLPVFDNLERATAHAETATDVKPLADGIALVKRQFLDTLSKIGIERIKSQGEPFDPAFHEAVQQFETTDHPPGTVIHEVQAGYKQGDKLLRPAVVVVAKAPPN
jgi:molecular chaperone GrpE